MSYKCGHPRTTKNTVIRRVCRICCAKHSNKHKEKKRNEAKAKNTV